MEENQKEQSQNSLQCKLLMNEPNQEIEIYKGPFVLQGTKNYDQKSLNYEGYFKYTWYPKRRVLFYGTGGPTHRFSDSKPDVYINGMRVSKAQYTSITGNYVHENHGFLTEEDLIFGEKDKGVEKVCFSVPNFRNIQGAHIIEKNRERKSHGRFTADAGNYVINLDKLFGYNQFDKLEKQGGYLNLYCGELKAKNNATLSFKEAHSILNCFGEFLSFINGARTSCLFRFGCDDKQNYWYDFSNYSVDPHKNVPTLFPDYVNSINSLWPEFYSLYSASDSNRNFFKLIIHWYVEANKLSGDVEGSIILAQTGLELLTNWELIERKQIITNEREFAVIKIRTLLQHIGQSTDIPTSLTNLANYAQTLSEKDGPNAIVYIRNALAHSGQAKRNIISSLSYETKKEAHSMAIYYIELSLLYILQYNGRYNNRCS